MPTESFELYGQKFNWDREKNLSNIEKHGISFKSAAMTFFDPNAEIVDDIIHLIREVSVLRGYELDVIMDLN